MPGKQKIPAPIDRPLSRAYLRQFTGWSTAFPPGHSEPTSLRLMENVFVDRNGSLAVRPGLRYLSYTQSPDTDPLTTAVEGIGIDRPLVGTQEPFYVTGGAKALLFAVRETDQTVGFRALLFSESEDLGVQAVVHRLTDEEIGFQIPQGETALSFTSATTHVEYLQIDNKIVALSDAGETARMFFVGGEKVAKRVNAVTYPRWEDNNKLTVVHPDKTWVDKQPYTTRRNEILNSSFEVGGKYWNKSATTSWWTETTSPVVSTHRLALGSTPERTNLQTSPLHDVSSTGTAGWHPHPDWGAPDLSKDGDWMKIYDKKGKGTFLAYGARLTYGVKAGQKYQVALDYDIGTHVQPIVVLTFYNSSGAKIGKSTSLEMPKTKNHYGSSGVTAPPGTVSMRISIGGRNEAKSSTWVKAKNVLLCKEEELTTPFFSGATGTNYFWVGTANASPSVYHPPKDVSIDCANVPVRGGNPFNASIYVAANASKACSVWARGYDKNNAKLVEVSKAGTAAAAWTRLDAAVPTPVPEVVRADLMLLVPAVKRGEHIYVDAALLESEVSVVGPYFDGTTTDTPTVTNEWMDRNRPHETQSIQTTKVATPITAPAETPTAKTLIAIGGPTANTYKMGFFYTFENEFGESAPSKITEVRVSRPWSNWVWETMNASGEPSGAATDVADLCADQLVVTIPKPVYDQAVQEGAIRWNLYGFAWSDQEAVPVVAQLVGDRDLYADTSATTRVPAQIHEKTGWINLTPSRKLGVNDNILPNRTNRVNFSLPPKSRTGVVAGDRIILLGDPDMLATIRWSSNRPGEYTNFTAARGGGTKTLTSGNLNIPGAIVLWQNPQSVDTLTILCMSLDGASVSYYMQPASINAQSGSTNVMGFEETTSTPGTVSPYGNEVLNNALFRPTDFALLKSTASNYNISHKTQTDKIANQWWALQHKQWIMSAILDNRLYYLVHNPQGELLEEGCKGNEIWVYDIGTEAGSWSRFLVQGAALRVFSLGIREFVGVTRPEGLYYLDQDARADDYAVTDTTSPNYRKVYQRPIPWSFETNTQGANRAHDAWAHLQQIQITLGDFSGTLKYGIRGQDVNGNRIDMSKLFTDDRPVPDDETLWDVDDILQVRRDMKEWFFYASSVDGKYSSGQIGYVQYRYTPVSVNVGYEYGSVETFEYGTNVESGPTVYSDNGIPIPMMDYTRP